MTLQSHCLSIEVLWTGVWKEGFSAAFNRGDTVVLYKVRSIGVGEQFLSLVLKYLSHTIQCVRLYGKDNASVDVVLVVSQGSILRPLLFILYTSNLVHIVVLDIMRRIHAFISRPLWRPQGMKSVKQDLATIDSWYLNWHMRLNPKKTMSVLVCWPGYCDLSLGGAELRR